MRRVTLKRSMMSREEIDQVAIGQPFAVRRKPAGAVTTEISNCQKIESEVRAEYVIKVAVRAAGVKVIRAVKVAAGIRVAVDRRTT